MNFYNLQLCHTRTFVPVSTKTLLQAIVLLGLYICSLMLFYTTSANADDLSASSQRTKKKILALGDSLTAGYGLDISQAYPSQLEKRLLERSYSYEVINAGVSGDTTAGGIRRLPWLFKQDISILILALGANDGLRGFSPSVTKENLVKIIDLARSINPKIQILLAGMYAPPNMGETFGKAYQNVFSTTAKEKNVSFLPFLLAGVAGEPALNQADGIHPNEEGYKKVTEVILRHLEPMLDAE